MDNDKILITLLSKLNEQMCISNKLKHFELELMLKEKYGLPDSGGSIALQDLNACMKN